MAEAQSLPFHLPETLQKNVADDSIKSQGLIKEIEEGHIPLISLLTNVITHTKLFSIRITRKHIQQSEGNILAHIL